MDDSKALEFLNQALDLARLAARTGEVPVGALVVDSQGKILGSGSNRRETDQNPIAHAEILALQAAAQTTGSWRLTGARLLVTLEPCPMCLAACQQARVDEVFYAAADPKGGALSLGYRLHEDVRTNHRFPIRQLELPEAGLVLTEFFRARRSGEL